jgi:hypothetical protein
MTKKITTTTNKNDDNDDYVESLAYSFMWFKSNGGASVLKSFDVQNITSIAVVNSSRSLSCVTTYTAPSAALLYFDNNNKHNNNLFNIKTEDIDEFYEDVTSSLTFECKHCLMLESAAEILLNSNTTASSLLFSSTTTTATTATTLTSFSCEAKVHNAEDKNVFTANDFSTSATKKMFSPAQSDFFVFSIKVNDGKEYILRARKVYKIIKWINIITLVSFFFFY